MFCRISGRSAPHGVFGQDALNGGKQCQLAEFEVIKAGGESFSNDALQLSSAAASGEADLTDRLVLTNIDKSAITEGKVVKAEYNITRGSDVEYGTVILYNAWNSVSLTVSGEGQEITAVDLGGTENQFVTGFFFRDLLATDKIDVRFSVVDAE